MDEWDGVLLILYLQKLKFKFHICFRRHRILLFLFHLASNHLKSNDYCSSPYKNKWCVRFAPKVAIHKPCHQWLQFECLIDMVLQQMFYFFVKLRINTFFITNNNLGFIWIQIFSILLRISPWVRNSTDTLHGL